MIDYRHEAAEHLRRANEARGRYSAEDTDAQEAIALATALAATCLGFAAEEDRVNLSDRPSGRQKLRRVDPAQKQTLTSAGAPVRLQRSKPTAGITGASKQAVRNRG